MLGQVIKKTYKHLDMINPILEKKKGSVFYQTGDFKDYEKGAES